MNANARKTTQSAADESWDLFRISKSKAAVDLSSNTLRKFNREGLRFYKVGKSIFISRQELSEFIRTRSSFGSITASTAVKSKGGL